MPSRERTLHLKRLDRLAQVAVHVGLRPAEGQQVIMTAPTTALPLVRLITEHAYKAGAGLVTTIYSDPQCTLARYQHAPDGSFDTASDWLFQGMASGFNNNAARLAIASETPGLLGGQDEDKVSRAATAQSKAYTPAIEKIAGFSINWAIVASANPQWAKQMFPELSQKEAMAKLWDAIFQASRVDRDDPVAAWHEHNAALQARKDILNGKRYSALKYRGPGTELTVGLADDHEWCGGETTASNGISCNPNIPTEEVFTTPHALRVNGHVTSTKPLSLHGNLVEDLWVRFVDGRIVEVRASKGEDIFRKHIGTDDGGCRLGEVALVPHSSPISASGLLFYNTLFDENAASHLAVGQSYSKCIIDGKSMSAENLSARGANSSSIHTDWMVGSGEIDIDGVHQNGDSEPLMRSGEWA